MENWKDLKGFEGLYQISDYGNIRNNKFVMKQQTDRHGYKYICLTKNNIQKKFKVHRLVLESFIGDGSELVCNHIDKNRANNNLNNLEWVTIRENNIHKFKDKTNHVGVNLKNGKWYARVQIDGRRTELGYFRNIEDAIQVRCSFLTDNGIITKY
jgi:NUMOD4 motif/HNH endonuclease